MVDRVVVAVGMKCPRPLFEVSKNMKEVAVGDVLVVEADDPAFKLDIEAWCRRTGNELLELREQSGRFVARVRRTK